jgi:hypothetical protein
MFGPQKRLTPMLVSENENNLNLTLTPWPWSASELYRPSDRRLLAKLVRTFADRECRVVSTTDSHGR